MKPIFGFWTLFSADLLCGCMGAETGYSIASVATIVLSVLVAAFSGASTYLKTRLDSEKERAAQTEKNELKGEIQGLTRKVEDLDPLLQKIYERFPDEDPKVVIGELLQRMELMEKRQKPRAISGEQRRAFERALGNDRFPVLVGYHATGEPQAFAGLIVHALQRIGWNVVDGGFRAMRRTKPGIEVHFSAQGPQTITDGRTPPPARVSRMTNALRALGEPVDAVVFDANEGEGPPSGTVLVIVYGRSD